MRYRLEIESVAFILTLLGCRAAQSPAPGHVERAHAREVDALAPVATSSFEVASGQIKAASAYDFSIRSPVMRLVVPNARGSAATLAFTYQGPSREMVPLASGEERRQIGLKLRSQDACNVIYVMWHIQGSSSRGIHVQVKANPGQSTSQACGDHGYHTVPARHAESVPDLRVGERHSMHAFIEANTLRVSVDGRQVWEGELPQEALALEGPVGMRSDNGDFAARFYASPLLASRPIQTMTKESWERQKR